MSHGPCHITGRSVSGDSSISSNDGKGKEEKQEGIGGRGEGSTGDRGGEQRCKDHLGDIIKNGSQGFRAQNRQSRNDPQEATGVT